MTKKLAILLPKEITFTFVGKILKNWKYCYWNFEKYKKIETFATEITFKITFMYVEIKMSLQKIFQNGTNFINPVASLEHATRADSSSVKPRATCLWCLMILPTNFKTHQASSSQVKLARVITDFCVPTAWDLSNLRCDLSSHAPWEQGLIGLWKYFVISKIFWVNYKKFSENYSENFKLTLGKFQRIKKSQWNFSEILRKIRYF